MEDHLHPNWKALASAHLKWKVFVQARNGDQTPEEKSKTYITGTSFTGEEAKEIYEDIIQKSTQENAGSSEELPGSIDENTGSSEELPDASHVSDPSTSKLENGNVIDTEIPEIKIKFDARSINRGMMYAQNNEVSSLTNMLRKGFNVNSKDEHGWSLLMVAACAGSFDVVQVLLKHKARSGVRDARGNTAIYLASIKGHKKIVDLLIKSRKRYRIHEVEDNKTASPSVTHVEFFCDICKRMIKESTHLQHETSIVHQFHVGSSMSKTVYGIPASNKGYQLLLNQGWDAERGLGPKRSGAKFPVKTVLKRNREGIGSGDSKEKARVTHFGPGDKGAVQAVFKSGERIMRPKILSKKERRKEKLEEMKKEIDLRRMLHEPDC